MCKWAEENKMLETNVKLRANNGTVITPVGVLKVNVKYKNMLKRLDLYIVK